MRPDLPRPDSYPPPAEEGARSSSLWLLLAGLNGLISVAAGAYGRHGAFDPAGREMFAIAANYQMTHALALLGVAWLASRQADGVLSVVNVAGAAFTIGILLFSGTLYWFGVYGLVPVTGAAPTGGFLLMAGWLALVIQAVRGMRS